MQQRKTLGGRYTEKRTRVLVVGVMGVLGLSVAVLLNRTTVGAIIPQFSLYWSIESNRLIIVVLFIRIALITVLFAALGFVCSFILSRDTRHEQGEKGVMIPQQLAQEQGSGEADNMQHRTLADVPSYESDERAVQGQEMEASESSGLSSSVQAISSPDTPLPATSFEAVVTRDEEGQVQLKRVELGSVSEEQREEPASFEEDGHDDEASVTSFAERDGETNPTYIEISLLKQLRVKLYVPALQKRYRVKLDDLHPKAKLLIAYLAWCRGKPTTLDYLRTHVFGGEEADSEQMQSGFSTAKRDIRDRIRKTAEAINKAAGQAVLPEKLDMFVLAPGKQYSLPTYCRVVDLEYIEAQQRIIDQAESGNQLVNEVPQTVKAACDALIQAYTGDFLEDVLIAYPDAIGRWPDSWAREPFTTYKDYYLQALLYAGEYTRKEGDHEADPARKLEYYASAARIFTLGAMSVCSSRVFDGRFDTMVYFAKTGRREGHHVTLSEHLIRRAIAYFGMTGATTSANKAYQGYEKQMLHISGRTWSPNPKTVRVLEEVAKQTGNYMLSEAISTPYEVETVLHSETTA